MKRGILAASLLLTAVVAPANAVEPYRLCAHASITGAAPIPWHPDRFGQYYFDAVNAEQGGVNGRPVQMTVHDDGYYPAGARAAAERCLRDGVDLLVGLSGGDVTKAVGTWAERKGVPYLHDTWPESWSDEVAGEASFAPSVEQFAEGLADLLVRNGNELAGAPPVFGMVVANTPGSDAEVAAFRSALEARGAELAVVVPVQKDEQVFAAAYRDLIDARVNAVNVATHPALMSRMIAQRPAGYEPVFASSQPGAGSSNVARSAGGAQLMVLNDPAPVYPLRDRSPYAAEVAEFHRIYDTYAPAGGPPRDDLDWMYYLRAKQLHRMLLGLAGDGASAFFDLFESYRERPAAAFPACALDFATRPTLGQDAAHVFVNAGGSWQQRATCATAGDGTDIAAPTIACEELLVQGAVACSFTDVASGVGRFSLVATRVEGGRTGIRDHGECDSTRLARLRLRPGVYEVVARASDCSGSVAEAVRTLVVL